jgi:hypothetical protein
MIRKILVLTGVMSSSLAFAQAKIVPTDDIKGAEKTDVPAWNPFLGVTSTLTLNSNDSVVGQVDGFSTLFGIGLNGGADYVKDKHTFRASLSINESFARTPVVDEFIKTNDVAKLEGIYNYFFLKKGGGYGRLALTASLFPAEDVRGVPTSWEEKNPAGNIPLKQNAFRQRLAGSFNPFSVDESAGIFYDPYTKPKLNLKLRLGVGGRHTFAEDVLLIDDDDATDPVELLRLSDVHQLGLEAFAGASGEFKGGKAKYKAGLSVLAPFVNNDDADRSVGKLTRVGFEGQIQFNIYTWMSLLYTVMVTKDAQLFPRGDEKTQIQNSLLLTFTFTLVKKKEADKEKSAEQLELEAAKLRADEAEKRAFEAEKKLLELQPAPAPTPGVSPTPGATPMPAPAGTP